VAATALSASAQIAESADGVQTLEPLQRQAPSSTAPAPVAAQPVRLVGRKGEAYAVNPDGSVIAIPKQRIVFRNQSTVPLTVSSPEPEPAAQSEGEAAPPPPSADDQPQGEQKEGEPAIEEPAEGEPAESEPAPEATGEGENAPPPPKRDEKPEVKAGQPEKKEADPTKVARIRRLQGLNSWFYTEDGTPLSASDVDRLIREGEESKIRARDMYQQQYDFGAEKDDKDRPSGDKNWLP
jgi:hypothetical protein